PPPPPPPHPPPPGAPPPRGGGAPPPSLPLLPPRQRRIVAAGLTVLAAAVVAVAVVYVLRMALGFLSLLRLVVLPLFSAAVLALLFRPYYQWLRRCVRRDAFALILFYLSVSLPLLGILAGTGALVAEQVVGLLNSIPGTLLEMQEAVWARMPKLQALLVQQGWYEDVQQLLASLASFARAGAVDFASASAGATGAGLLAFGKALLAWAVLPIYLGYFLLSAPMEGDRLEPFLPFLKEKTRHNIVYLANQFLDMLVSFFRGQILIALIEAVLFGLGFWAVGLQYGFLIGFVLGLLNIVPYLGNIIGLSVIIPMAAIQGGMVRLCLCLGVFCVVQAADWYFITPRVMGNRTGLHPVVVIFSLFFWGILLDGVLGLMIGIPLSAFVVAVWRLAREQYLANIKDLV
ncbi:MAG: AI-2E family transporter, partial [Kiritimatiellaeota bacterium]|nr:AI-2E family transporter [Kiritimatiellota bacterium]